MIKIYLDTNVFIDQSLASRREEEHLTKRLKNAVTISDLFTKEEIFLVVSGWTLLEYQTVMQDIWLEKKLIELGYHAREFREIKRNVKLTKEELEEVKGIVEFLKKDSLVETHELDFNFIQKLVDTGIEFIDAILIFQAEESKCKYFVTRDDVFYNKVRSLDLGIRVVKPEQFLKLIKNK